MYLEIEHGGWCPKGRLAEDGAIPEKYALREMNSPDYAIRTEQNVIDSDGTLIIYRDRMSGGTLLTSRLADKHKRPKHEVNLEDAANPEDFASWAVEFNIAVLNVAGPRGSSDFEIHFDAQQLLLNLLEPMME